MLSNYLIFIETPGEFAKNHKEFARAFESFPGDADNLFPGWREKLGVKAA